MNKAKMPKTKKEIDKYIKSMGYKLQYGCDFGDLVGVTIWIPKRGIYIPLNEYGKYSVSMQGSKKKAYLCAAQKAYWFVKKYLKKQKVKK